MYKYNVYIYTKSSCKLNICNIELFFRTNASRKAYIAGIEDTGKATLYLRLSCSLVSDCQIKDDDEFLAEIQFQMNRLPLSEMHHAIDQLPDMDLVYPNPNPNLQIPWTPGKQWAEDMSSKLNAKQREAIIAITCPLEVKNPFFKKKKNI